MTEAFSGPLGEQTLAWYEEPGQAWAERSAWRTLVGLRGWARADYREQDAMQLVVD